MKPAWSSRYILLSALVILFYKVMLCLANQDITYCSLPKGMLRLHNAFLQKQSEMSMKFRLPILE